MRRSLPPGSSKTNPIRALNRQLTPLRGSTHARRSLLFFEIRNALLVGERRNRIPESVANAFLRELALLRIRLEPPGDGVEMMSLARDRKLTVCDAAYLELAKREGLPLATLDRDLERAAIAEGVALF